MLCTTSDQTKELIIQFAFYFASLFSIHQNATVQLEVPSGLSRHCFHSSRSHANKKLIKREMVTPKRASKTPTRRSSRAIASRRILKPAALKKETPSQDDELPIDNDSDDEDPFSTKYTNLQDRCTCYSFKRQDCEC